jgi:hypothetical protein
VTLHLSFSFRLAPPALNDASHLQPLRPELVCEDLLKPLVLWWLFLDPDKVRPASARQLSLITEA